MFGAYLGQDRFDRILRHSLSVELQPGQPWSESQVVQLLQEVLGILQFVHSQGLIHRDIKPSNLIRREQDNRLVLIDFGSVKQAWTQVVTAQGQTKANFALGIAATIAIGTQGYMPTEQGRGRPRPNSDIYALGMIGIQALTGLSPTQLLEDSDTGEIIWQHQAQVSTELAYVLKKMVYYHFKDRYQSAQEVLQALQPLVKTEAPAPSQIDASSTPVSRQIDASLNGGNPPTGLSPRTQLAPQPGEPPHGTGSSTGGSPSSGDARRLLRASLTRSQSPPKVLSPRTELAPQRGKPPHTTGSPAPTSPHKSTSVIGVAAGVASALALTVGSYYLLEPVLKDGLQRPSAPASKVQQYPVSISDKNTSLEKITLANTLTGHSEMIWSTALSQDGQTLASSSGDQTIKIWNLRTGKLRSTLAGHAGMVLSVALSRDGQTLASSSWDQTVKVWNLRSGELLRTLSGSSKEAWSVAISPDGQTLVSGSGDINQLWNLRTGELLRNLSGHSDTVWSVAISPGGQTFASGSKDKTIKIWDLRSGEVLHTLTGHSDRVRSVAISPDGQTVASGSWDKTIKIWNLRSGELLHTLTGHSSYVNSVSISPSGAILASGSDDQTIKLWNLRTGELLRTLTGHSGHINSVTFDAGGKILVSGSGDKTIKVWRL